MAGGLRSAAPLRKLCLLSCCLGAWPRGSSEPPPQFISPSRAVGAISTLRMLLRCPPPPMKMSRLTIITHLKSIPGLTVDSTWSCGYRRLPRPGLQSHDPFLGPPAASLWQGGLSERMKIQSPQFDLNFRRTASMYFAA